MPQQIPPRRLVFNKPPLFLTDKTPEEIIGIDLMPSFIMHYKACMKCNPDEFDKIARKFDQVVRDDIGEAYTRLLKNGFHPDGLNSQGIIRWAIVADSRPDREEWLELDLLIDQGRVAEAILKAEECLVVGAGKFTNEVGDKGSCYV